MYERHKQAAVAYAAEAFGIVVTAIDAKHDSEIPDGVLVLLKDQNDDRLAMLLHEDLAVVAQDSLDEEDFLKGTVRS